MSKLKTFHRDAAWLVLLIILASTAAAVAVVGFRKRMQSEVTTYQNRSEIRFGLPRLARDLDLDRLRTIEDYEVLSKIHQSLVSLDQVGRIYPGVARNWTVLDNGRAILFQLRTHLEFSSGKPFRCSDAIETFRHLKQMKDSSLWALSIVKSMECKSDFQFLVNLERPSPFFLSELADIRYSIRRADRVHETRGHDLDGLGPYRVVDFKEDSDAIVLHRKENSPFVTAQAPLRVRYEKIAELQDAVQQLKDGSLDLYPLRGRLVEPGKFIVSSHRIDRVWMLIVSKKMFQRNPKISHCLNSMLKRDNIVSAMKDQAFLKTNTVVSLDENVGQNRFLMNSSNMEQDPSCRRALPSSIRLMTMQGHDARIIDAISHELKRAGVQVRDTNPVTKEAFISKLPTDGYDLAIYSLGMTNSPASDLAFLFINNRVFAPSQWVDKTLHELAQKITLSRNEMEAHERIAGLLGQSLKKSPLVALFFEKERYLSGKCVKIIDPDRFRLNQQFAAIVREKSCRD